MINTNNGWVWAFKELEAEGGGGEVSWDGIQDKPAVIAAGATAAAARAVIGAISLAEVPPAPAAPTWTTLAGKPAVIASGADAAAARASIGAISLAEVPGGSTTTWATLDGKPTVIGAGATQADARAALGISGGAGTVYTNGFGGAFTLLNYTAEATGGTMALRDPLGRMSAANASADGNVTTLAQLNGRLSAAQRTAINALDAATATVADIVNALKA